MTNRSHNARCNLRERALPEPLYIKDLVKDLEGRPAYCYEDWLRELVNQSSAFMVKTGGKKFEAPVDESHGEADAVTDNYCLDFKIILGQSRMRAGRECSQQMTVMDGMTFFSPSRAMESMRYVRLHAALRDYDQDRLRRLWDLESPSNSCDEIDRDVIYFLNTLKKEKNLLLLNPVLLFTEDGSSVSLDDVCEAVYSDFRFVLDLRREYLPDYESYIAFFVPDSLVVVEAAQNEWMLFDAMPFAASKTFMEILRHCDPLDENVHLLIHGN